MIHFENDYLQGAHPKILERLVETNMEKLSGYGFDEYSDEARDLIRDMIDRPRADIYFLNSGTQTNAIAIKSILRPYEGVIACETAHVATQEAGAIEAGGNKVITMPGHEGKISPEELEERLMEFRKDENNIHMVRPGLVFISVTTELGTLYTKEELQRLYKTCQDYRVELYIDGARLGYALASEENDLTIKDIVDNCDCFYIGGCKLGALMGEALVFPEGTPYDDYTTYIKGQGALISKSRLLGVQFTALLENDLALYLENGRHGNEMAALLRKGLREKGYEEYVENSTNLIFLVVDQETLKDLDEKIIYSKVGPYEKDKTKTIIRLATSWGTKEEDVKEILNIL